MLKVALILLAAGSSTRMGGQKKEFLLINGETILSKTLNTFLKTRKFSTIVVTYPKGQLEECKSALKFSLPKNILFVEGGATRQLSVKAALDSLVGQNIDFVLIHDGARPFITENLILETLNNTIKFGAVTPVVQPIDTQVELDSNSTILRHLVRKNLGAVQTPQGFKFKEIYKFHKMAQNDGMPYTDDTEIWDAYSKTKTHIIQGEDTNIKITFPKDLNALNNKAHNMEEKDKKQIFRVGLGYDLHKLVEGRTLMIGGILIPFNKGEEAHSDGDVLLHAIIDALLGASALGDIGSYFPPTEEKWRDANSKELLSIAWDDVKKAGWKLENLDCVIKLENPKFLPHRQDVRTSIANILCVQCEKIFVKAKTSEKLDSVGQGNAIEAFATCLLSQK